MPHCSLALPCPTQMCPLHPAPRSSPHPSHPSLTRAALRCSQVSLQAVPAENLEAGECWDLLRQDRVEAVWL